MVTIGKLFGKSPFNAFHEHMVIAEESAEQVIHLIEAFIQGDKKKYIEISQKISKLETEADSVKNAIRDNLPRSMLMPVNRHDLLVTLDYQDSIADRAQDIGVLLTLKEITVPENIRDDLRHYVDSAVKVCVLAAEISENLNELVSRFGISSSAENIREMVGKLSVLESENDRKGHDLIRIILENEAELTPVEIFLWFRLIMLIGDLADFAQKTANRMRSLIAR